jgi:hypothetical protein
MLEKNTIITLDNDKKFTVLRTMDYKGKSYALITDYYKENHVVLVENDEKGIVISLIEDPKEEEIIINIFLKDSLEELKNYQEENESE